MRVRKWILRGVLMLVVALIGVAAVLFVMASQFPEGYEPPLLTQEQRKQAAHEFVEQAAALHKGVWADAPLIWSATQEQLNRYLTSMDEIAWLRKGGKLGEVDRKLAKLGLSGLAIRLGDGMMTLMAKSEKHGKVLSVDFSLEFTPEKKLQAKLGAAHVGKLRVPDAAFRKRFAALKKSLAARAAQENNRKPPADPRSGDDMVKILAKILAAIDEEPIAIEQEVNNRVIRLDGVDLSDGRLTLRFRPLGRQATTSQAS